MSAIYFLVRYNDFTLDTIRPASPDLIDEFRDVADVESIIPMGAAAELILDRDGLVRRPR